MKSERAETPARLRDVQEEFLRGLRGGPDTTDDGTRAFAPPPRGDVAARWHVYRDGYRIRLTAAIGNDYPAVRRILGPGPFESLIARYLAAHPPHAHDISRAGDQLPAFLAGDPLGESLPFLPDLARFEAALSLGVVAADPTPVDRSALAAQGEELFDRALTLGPGASYLDSPWPLADLWETRDRPDEEIDLRVEGRPDRILVHREGVAVRWRRVPEEDEASFLSAASGGGATLARLCDGGRFGSPETAAPRLVSMLLDFLTAGAVCFADHRAPDGVQNRKENER